MDATNAFNAINREAMLHNISIKCPSFSQYVNNTYGNASKLYITGGNRQGDEDIIQSEEGTTQGDPIAMAMYGIGMSVLQSGLAYGETKVKSVAYADDYSGAGKVEDLMKWWKKLETIGPQFGYFPNAGKSCLIVKPEKELIAKKLFEGTNLKITVTGQRHLGAVIGSNTDKERYVKEKVTEWIKEVRKLSEIAKTEPQAAYTAFTFGLKHKWNYILRTIPGITELLQPLEDCIRNEFMVGILNGHICSDDERDLLALPPRMGGLGIINPAKMTEIEHSNSLKVTAALTKHIIEQNTAEEIDGFMLNLLTAEISKSRHDAQESELRRILAKSSDEIKRMVEVTQETGASNWLSSLPIKAKGFSLNKQEFFDALALRYGWPIKDLPDLCPCGKPFTQHHAMICSKGGFICNRHNEVRDIIGEILKEICDDVAIEPHLQPLSGETFVHKTANTDPAARVDISARGFWTRGQRAYFDIRIFDPMAPSHRNQSLQYVHEKNENEKMRNYGDRIRKVEHGSFTPLVFTTSGGMSHQTKIFFNRVAELMAEKKREPKGFFTAWFRTRLSFSLVRSALLCLRGTRSSKKNLVKPKDIDYEDTVVESRINFKLAFSVDLV